MSDRGHAYRITVTTSDAAVAQPRCTTTARHQHESIDDDDGGSDNDDASQWSVRECRLPLRNVPMERYRSRSKPSHPWEDFRFPRSLPAAPRAPNILTTTAGPSSHRLFWSPPDPPANAVAAVTASSVPKKKKRPWEDAAPKMPRFAGGNTTTADTIPAIPLLSQGRIQPLGPPHLRVFKVSLPFDAAGIFRRLILACEDQAQRQSDQWETKTYSLTKQDMAVADVRGGLELVQEIQSYVQSTIRHLYSQPVLHMDRNQPHVLKYDGSSDHRSVPMHFDCCHVTVNMMMSVSTDYEGGGTYLRDLDQRVVLEQGEFLLHPGNLIHAGCEITAGTRYLLVSFVHFPAPTGNYSSHRAGRYLCDDMCFGD